MSTNGSEAALETRGPTSTSQDIIVYKGLHWDRGSNKPPESCSYPSTFEPKVKDPIMEKWRDSALEGYMECIKQNTPSISESKLSTTKNSLRRHSDIMYDLGLENFEEMTTKEDEGTREAAIKRFSEDRLMFDYLKDDDIYRLVFDWPCGNRFWELKFCIPGAGDTASQSSAGNSIGKPPSSGKTS